MAGLSPQQIKAAKYVAQSAPQVVKELVRLRDVIFLLNQSNKHNLKKHILTQYTGSLKDLIQFIYNPRVRMNVTSKTLLNHVKENQMSGCKPEEGSILSILKELNSKEITGNAKLDKLGNFLNYLETLEGKVRDDQLKQKISVQEVFLRCLDRNLQAGINILTVQEVYDNNTSGMKKLLQPKLPAHLRKGIMQQKRFDEIAEGVKSLHGQSSIETDPILQSNCKNNDGKNTTSEQSDDKWGVALGQPSNFEELQRAIEGSTAGKEEGIHSWYLSRKLDGVRCIIRVNVEGNSIPLKVTNIETLSRQGRSFTSLKILTDNLAKLIATSDTIETVVKRVPPRSDENDQRTIYIDGELCALVPQSEGVEGYMEDFKEIVGLVRRQEYTIEKPAFFPFDLLTHIEFEQWKEQSASPENHEPFYLRKRRVEAFLRHCQEQESVNVRALEQTHVTNFEQVRAFADEAASKGWEGLILRRGDHYKGKRSPSIRKYKQWQDAEYKVIDVQKAVMRLPIDQVYGNHEALASVSIEHKGTEVLVGSGFTVEQRLRYAKDPASLIGKEITVQYFTESTSANRANKDETSLRFPRIKKIWEEGQRSM